MTARSSAGSTAARSRSSTASRRPCPQPSPCPPTSSASRTAASWWTSVAELVVTALRVAAGRSTDGLHEAVHAEAERIGFDARFLDRPLNVDLSGGEKKRNETLQLGVLGSKIAVLDEIDSGLDVDALRAVSRRIEALTNERAVGVLAITHYSRLLHELRPDRIHVLVKGHIRKSAG